MKDFNDDQNCFVCGKKNPAGLKIEFNENPQSGEAEAEVIFPPHLQGWQGTVHGGLLATVLDETMIKAAAFAGHKCVTAEMTVKYKKPAATGKAYRVAAKILETRGRIILAESRVCDISGQVLAQASGKLFKV
ncbi:MAG: PaaI family thioesterase [Candidatus Aminicenantes bacterium]|nr:PaaI family thioesterase [Candidatus Aminicenantes bacterium]